MTAAAAAAPSARRIQRGRNHSYEIDGQKVPGVTTILGKGYPKPALIEWAGNHTALYAVNFWDELAEQPAGTRIDRLRRARFDYRDEAATRGKQAHELIWRLAKGQEVDVPDELAGYVDAYEQFARDWQPQELLIETPVFSFEFRYAGTLDTVAKLADGQTWLLDWKTGGKGIFTEHVLQLAAYRYADAYLGTDNELHPMPAVDATGGVWIQDGTYELRPVDAGPDTFAAFGVVQQLHDFIADADVIHDALTPPPQEEATP